MGKDVLAPQQFSQFKVLWFLQELDLPLAI